MFKKKYKNKLIQLLIPLIYILLPSCSDLQKIPEGSDLKNFDSMVWQGESSMKLDENLNTNRQKMLKDLITNILPGKTKSEIEFLLGKSLKTSYFSSIDYDFIYVTGHERNSSFRIDSEWLLLWVDESGIFEKYEIRVD